MVYFPIFVLFQNHPLLSIRSNSAMAPRSGVAFTPPRLKTPSNRNGIHLVDYFFLQLLFDEMFVFALVFLYLICI